MALAGTLVIGLQARTEQLERDMAKVRGEIKRTKESVVETQSVFKNLGSSLLGLTAGVASVSALSSAVKDLVSTGIELKNLQTSFALISGSAEKGKSEFAFLRDTANSLGIDLKSLAGDYRLLSAATRGTAVEGEQTRQLFTQLTSAARNYGMSAEQTGRAVQAFSQIISKGKVEQEELRGQLSEAIPGAMQIAARAFGVGTAELGKMVEQGLEASKFVKAFTEQLSREAPAATEIAGKGLAQLGNEVFELKGRIANSGLVQLFDELAAKGAELLRVSRLAAEESVRAGKAALGAAADFATAAEIRQAASAVEAQQQGQSGVMGFLFGGSAGGPGASAIAQKNLEELRKAAERRKSNKEAGDAALLESGLAPSQQTNRAAIEAIEAQKEAERVKGRFNEIANRTDALRAAQDKAAKDAEKRVREAASEAKRLAREKEHEEERAAKAEMQRLREIQAEEERNIEQLRNLAEQYVSTQEVRDADTASMLAASLATSQYAKESAELVKVITEVQKVEAQLPQLRAEAERSAAALAAHQDGVANLERYEELLGLGMSKESRQFLKAKGELSPMLGADGIDPQRIHAVLKQLDPEFRKLMDTANEFADSFLSAIDRAVSGGIKSFKDFFGSIAMDFARILQQQYLAPAFGKLVQQGLGLAVGLLGGATAGGGTGAFDGSVIGGGTAFASGGPVMHGGFYMVGEEGPERVWLNRDSYVEPNGGGSGGNITVNMNVYAQDAGSFKRSQGEIQGRMLSAIRGASRNG